MIVLESFCIGGGKGGGKLTWDVETTRAGALGDCRSGVSSTKL